jgi:glycosyltransferase involved in cell wall biosynthesis
MKPLVVHIITSLDDGGAEAVLYRLCLYGPASQQRVICLMREGKYGPLLRQAGVVVHCLGLGRGELRPGALLRLWWLLRQFQPDLVQTWMYHSDLIGGIAARLAGVRLVVWGVRTSQLDTAAVGASTQLAVRICALLSWLLPDRIVCCAVRSIEVHRRLGYCGARFVVIPNGYDLEAFQPDRQAGLRLRAQIGVPPETPLLGMVARFDPQKDHRTLLEALVLLRNMGLKPPCLLVGSQLEPANPAMQSWLQQLGLAQQVYLLGSRNDVPALMNALSLHVLSSAYGEAFPNVLAEAMACGVPCVATDVGDSGLILGTTGWLVPPKDPQALAAALADGLQEPQAQHHVRRRAARQHIANQFSITNMVYRYTELYGTLA